MFKKLIVKLNVIQLKELNVTLFTNASLEFYQKKAIIFDRQKKAQKF